MPHAQTHLLVVDDNAATRYSTSHILKAAGYEVLNAGSGLEAIETATRSRPSLVVLDINLPDIDGFQVCRELRGRPQTRRIPIMYLSATFVDDTDKIQGLDAGADGYLTHPVEPPVLIATVRALLRARQAEDAVKESEAKFMAVFEHALNGIALLSRDFVFIDANPSLCHVLGRERDAIVGRHLSVFTLKERPLDIDAVSDALEQRGQWRGSAPLLNAVGGHVELEWSVSRYAASREVQLAIVSDVTQRMAVEADRERLLSSERAARAEAERANQLKDDFLAALSHELRTPLNAIVGFARVLQHSAAVSANPRDVASVNAIERNAWVQAQLISDLLDISRITSGKLELDRQRLHAAEAVQSALASLESLARARQVTIEADLDASDALLWWDPSRFQQVVWNLVGNAVKFSKVGGVVRVRLRHLPSTVELAVTDHGQGIAADFLPHVFDRFRQENATSKRGHGGLGLGLTIVHQLVTAHGGTIRADSQGEGHGATFTVRLPLLSAAALPMQVDAPVARPPDLRGRRILVVDDNDDARTLLRQILAGASGTVLDVSSVVAAVAALDEFQPDLLISDLAMPGQDGFDLIEHLRTGGWPAERLPAIALSAHARAEDRRRSLQAGYQEHVAKPPDITRLLTVVATLVGSRD
jgi:PAS domain S-box-containing protein